MSTDPVGGFLSYVRKDDEAENGHIVRIIDDLTAQYELITGDRLNIFVDRQNISWGYHWRSVIETALRSAAFFIPIITPRYFRSQECRREFEFFTTGVHDLGAGHFVMPIRYIDFPDLHASTITDPLVAACLSFQNEDWTELRLEAPDALLYRNTLTRMAMRLHQAVGTRSREADGSAVGGNAADADPESALSQVSDTLHLLVDDVREIVQHFERVSTQVVKQRTGTRLAARLLILDAFTGEHATSAIRVSGKVDLLTSRLAELEPILSAAIRVSEGPTAVDLERLEQLGDLLRTINAAMSDCIAAIRSLIAHLEPVDSMSDEVRSTVRALRRGQPQLTLAQDRMQGWADAADACADDNRW